MRYLAAYQQARARLADDQAVLILAVIPWRYVVAQYVTRRGDRWRPLKAIERPATPTRA